MTGWIPGNAKTQEWAFQGVAGEKAVIGVHASAFYPLVEIKDPTSGNAVAKFGPFASKYGRGSFTLTASGLHKIEVTSSWSSRSYEIVLHRTYPSPSPSSPEITFGVTGTIATSISPRGDKDMYWFTPIPGVNLDLNIPTAPSMYPEFEITDPNGKQVAYATGNRSAYITGFVPVQVGVHIVLVHGGASGGSYSINMTCNQATGRCGSWIFLAAPYSGRVPRGRKHRGVRNSCDDFRELRRMARGTDTGHPCDSSSSS